MKRLAWTAFVAFCSSVATLLAVGALSPAPIECPPAAQAVSPVPPASGGAALPAPPAVQPALAPHAKDGGGLAAVPAAAEPTPAAAAPAPLPDLTLAEVARHATASDCWMAIRGKVYDITAYIPEHPTSPRVVTRWCGKEATRAYETKGGRGEEHSEDADADLRKYLIGQLKN